MTENHIEARVDAVVVFCVRKKHAFGANSKLVKMDLFDIFGVFAVVYACVSFEKFF